MKKIFYLQHLTFLPKLKLVKVFTLLLTLLTSLLLLTSCEKDEDYFPVSVDKKIKVNGNLIHYKESGKGKPNVVFVSGLGESLDTWQEVQPDVADFASTFSYDRPGTGKSSSIIGPRTSTEIAKELHQLLLHAKVKAPYILVAHSMGGLHTRMFAQLYPDEVAGVVLLDPTTEEEILMLKNIELPDGVTLEQLFEQIAAEKKWTGSVKAEFMGQMQSAEQVSTANFPQVPLTLITPMQPEEGETPGTREMKRQLHAQFVAKVPGAIHTLAQQSTHHVQWDQPELVVETIKQMADKIK